MMNDPKIIEIIANLKGRRNYEEKKASKLGFASLYEYIEDKVTNGPSSKPAKRKSLMPVKDPRRDLQLKQMTSVGVAEYKFSRPSYRDSSNH